MKIRQGFVSNSSSSSFYIACKKMPTQEKMLEFLGVPKDSILYPIAKQTAKILCKADEVPEDDSDYEYIPEELLEKVKGKKHICS
jgi:hypothetical protein